VLPWQGWSFLGPVTNDEISICDGLSCLLSFAVFGEKASHHQTPIAFLPAVLRSRLLTAVA
jgi:hypothetical protein